MVTVKINLVGLSLLNEKPHSAIYLNNPSWQIIKALRDKP